MRLESMTIVAHRRASVRPAPWTGVEGIGAAIARAAAREGANVVVNYLDDESSAQAVAADIAATGTKREIVLGHVCSVLTCKAYGD